MKDNMPSCPNCGEDHDDMIDWVKVNKMKREITYYCNACGHEFTKPEEKQKVF